MRDACAKLVIIAGVVLLPIALIRSGAAVWQFIEMVNHGSPSWTYYIWAPTSMVQDWLIAIGLILVGLGLLSKPGK